MFRISIKHGKDKFLVLTTDGVSDVLSNSEIIKTICQSDAPSEAAERLVDQALLFSCEDNATVIKFSLKRNISLNIEQLFLGFDSTFWIMGQD